MVGHMRLSVLLSLVAVFVLFPDLGLSAGQAGSGPQGEGSLPARLYPNGTVCLVNPKKPAVCLKKLVQVPRRVMKAHSVTFYGVFDLDGDGSPEVFVEYWSPSSRRDGESVVLLVYKRLRGRYRQYLRLKAESYGYDPGAWFLNEPPYPKAVFMTRYGGSSGSGLFYLDLRKRSLDLISGPVFLEGNPKFVDLDGDGMAEIFLPGRGRDRTSQPGAAVLRWKDQGYAMWWPDWTGGPTVIYADLADIDGDGKQEIVAVLEPEDIDSDKHIDGKTPSARELAVWKVQDETPHLLSNSKLPKARYLAEPTLGRIPPFSSAIELHYFRTVGCTWQGGELKCRDDE